MRKIIILLFALLLMASCTAGPYGYNNDEYADAIDYREGRSLALTDIAYDPSNRYDETKEAEYLDYVTDKIADKIVEREATEEARDSYIYYGEERYRDENGLAHDIGSNYSPIRNETNNVSTNSERYRDENGLAHDIGSNYSPIRNETNNVSTNSERYRDENGLAHRGNVASTWTVDNYNTKELKRTGNYLYVPYPDEDPYKDSPEYQVEYQNYLDEHDGID